MSATVADYPEAVDRITEAHVRPEHTTRADVIAALRRDSGPQITPEVAADLADNILTEERVIEAIDSSGEVPTESEIRAFVDVSDDYDMDDRQGSVEEAIRERVATAEDIDRAVESRRPTDRPMFREDVESGVSEVASSKEIRGADPDDVVSEEAVERGAPRETDFRGAAARTAGSPDDVVSPADLGIGSQTTGVSVIRDTSGNPVVAFGGAGQIDGRPAGEAVAEELGAEYAGSGTEAIESISNDFRTSGTGESVNLTFRGRAVGEVDVR